MTHLVLAIQNAILFGTALLYGAVGETITEKSGNLNLGIPGIMSMGAISGFAGAFFYNNATKSINGFLAILIPLICCIIGSLIASLIYSFLTITLRANQNVTGLALTTFGVGFANFFYNFLAKSSGSGAAISLFKFPKYYKTVFPFAKSLGWFGEMFLSHGFLVYLGIAIAIVASYVLNKTRVGLHLRAVGENPATADAAGISVTKYRYFATCIGGVIAGLGGLQVIMERKDAIFTKDILGDIGWLAIALVIFTIWKPAMAIPSAYLFGGLLAIDTILTIDTMYQPLLNMAPYVMTIILLILTSIRNRREDQPPASLGVNYYREER